MEEIKQRCEKKKWSSSIKDGNCGRKICRQRIKKNGKNNGKEKKIKEIVKKGSFNEATITANTYSIR